MDDSLSELLEEFLSIEFKPKGNQVEEKKMAPKISDFLKL